SSAATNSARTLAAAAFVSSVNLSIKSPVMPSPTDASKRKRSSGSGLACKPSIWASKRRARRQASSAAPPLAVPPLTAARMVLMLLMIACSSCNGNKVPDSRFAALIWLKGCFGVLRLTQVNAPGWYSAEIERRRLGDRYDLAALPQDRDPANWKPSMAETRKHEKYEALIAMCRALAPVRTAVVHPCDQSTLQATIEAAQIKIIRPILVGPTAKIRAAAASAGLDIAAFPLIDTPHSHAAAAKAVELVRTGEADMLMKGSLHTDELMTEVVRTDTGIRTERRISHIFIMDVPTYPKPLFIT